MMNILWGLGGMLGILVIAFLLSKDKKAINLRTVLGALALQVTFGFIVLKWGAGKAALQWVSEKVQTAIGYSSEGINFVFGNLANMESNGFVFIIHALVVVIFFSSIVSVLYYLGIMQRVVGVIGGFLSKVLGTSRTESMSAAANIFLGATESPLFIKPYLAKLTKSELFAVMVGGFSSVAGSVLIGYAALGIPLEYLLAASFMAAPAGLLMAKIILPQTEKVTNDNVKDMKDTDSANVFDAAAKGASEGVQLVINIAAMLIAFISIIALLNGILGGIGGLMGIEGLSIERILGYAFAPLAFLIGVPLDEILAAGSLIGQKTVVNEFVAYLNFSQIMDTFSPKSLVVISFALCGFANFSVIAILLGGLGALAPTRRKEIAKLGLLAMIAGVLANLLSAAIAGMMF